MAANTNSCVVLRVEMSDFFFLFFFGCELNPALGHFSHETKKRQLKEDTYGNENE